MLDAALEYAGRGWPVFPCHPDSKQPLTPAAERDEAGKKVPGTGGLYHATMDEEVIRGWWKRWPAAMVGVPTGEKLGAFVIDLDPKDGESAEALLARLCALLDLTLPPAPIVRTPRGGMHIYFAMPEAVVVGNRANCGLPGVDVRGTGGYVIAPPSVRRGRKAQGDGCDGKAYRWEDDAGPEDFAPPEAPAALLRLVTDRAFAKALGADPAGDGPLPADGAERRDSAGETSAVADARTDAVRKFALAAFDAEILGVERCTAGGRNDRLNRAAFSLGQLVEAGALSESACVAGLEAAAGACGLTREDGIDAVRATIASGMAAGRGQPRDLAEVGQRAGTRRRAGPQVPFPEAPDGPAVRGSKLSPGSLEGGSGEDGEPDWEIIEACSLERQNDTGNGRRLIAHFGEDLLVVRDVGPHAWAGTHWEVRGGGEAFQRFAQRTAELVEREAECFRLSKRDKALCDRAEEIDRLDAGELTEADRKTATEAGLARMRLAKRKEARRKFGISSGNSARITGMIAQATPHITVPPEALDTEPLAINVANGTLRIARRRCEVPDPIMSDFDGDGTARTMQAERWCVELHSHARADRIAKLMPVTWDPDAACPLWDSFLERFQPEEAIRGFLRRYHGYALTGLTGEQMFLFNYGLGANGKSTFIEAIGRIMGDYAKVLPAEALTGDAQITGGQATPHFARLPGARLVRCSELPRGQNFREATLKMLTGGEQMLVRHNYGNFFEFVPAFKPVGSGNDRPQIGGVDEGIWRRMKLVEWRVRIPETERRPIEKVLAEFQEEASGILNWLLAGLLDYLENGMCEPEQVRAATESYRDDMDPVGEFIRACVESVDGEHVTAREMYEGYVAWAHANSVKPFAERGFASIMEQKGIEKERGRIRKYLNCRLKDVPDDPDARASYDDWTRP